MQLTPSQPSPLLFLQFSTSSKQQNKIQLYDTSWRDFHPSFLPLVCAIMPVKPRDQFNGQQAVPERCQRHQFCATLTLCPPFMLQLLSVCV